MTDQKLMPSEKTTPTAEAIKTVDVQRYRNQRWHTPTSESVICEEPLELWLAPPKSHSAISPSTPSTSSTPHPLMSLMRTPQHDRELLRGWLHTEGLWPQQVPSQQAQATRETQPQLYVHPENHNIWYLHTNDPEEQQRLRQGARLWSTSSACGVCGTGQMEQLATRLSQIQPNSVQSSTAQRNATQPLDPALLCQLPERLAATQTYFEQTGGSHAAALFDRHGRLLVAREDIGRHNAVDKVIGWWVYHNDGVHNVDGVDGTAGTVLCVSSRASFEIVQKAVMAGLSTVVTVGAASSLAVECAELFGVQLCAFTREHRLSLYGRYGRLD